MRRGTENRRRAVVRVLPDDWRSQVLLRATVLSTRPGASFCDWTDTTQITTALRAACRQLGLNPQWTAHCPRAGWAAAHYVRGTAFTEFLELSRWSSTTSARTYLDVVASSAVASQPDVMAWSDTMNSLDANFASLLAHI